MRATKNIFLVALTNHLKHKPGITTEVEAFHQRTLSKRYVCVNLDTIFLPVKRETVSKEAVYIAVGIREDGSKEVLAYTVAPTESAHVWKELFEDIHTRGVEAVLLFISDGLKGIKDNIHSVFPKARHQTCFIHVARHISHRVPVSERKTICEDLKSL